MWGLFLISASPSALHVLARNLALLLETVCSIGCLVLSLMFFAWRTVGALLASARHQLGCPRYSAVTMLLLVKYLEVPTTPPLAFHTYWLVASVNSLGPAPFHIWLHFSSSTLLFIPAAWILGAAVELVIVLSAHLAICWWNDWQSSLVVLKILPFPQRSFCLGPQKRLLRRSVLSRKIQEAERSHRLHPEGFFYWPQAVNCLILLRLLKTSDSQGACWKAFPGY